MGRLALLSRCGVVGYQGLACLAAHFTPAAHMALVNGAMPLFTVALALWLLHEPVGGWQVLGGLLALIGVWWTQRLPPARPLAQAPSAGFVWGWTAQPA